MFMKKSGFSTVTALLVSWSAIIPDSLPGRWRKTASTLQPPRRKRRRRRLSKKTTACKTKVSYNTISKSIRLFAVFLWEGEKTDKLTFLNEKKIIFPLSKCHSPPGLPKAPRPCGHFFCFFKYEGRLARQKTFIFMVHTHHLDVCNVIPSLIVAVKQKKCMKLTPFHWHKEKRINSVDVISWFEVHISFLTTR